VTALIARLNSFFRNLFGKRRRDQELDEEIHSTLALMTEEKIKRGMDPQEAARAARIELGGAEQLKEQVRAVRTGAWFDSFVRDVRFGLRILRKNPGFTAVAVLTIALGIGANTTIFSAANGIFLDPLPYADSSRLVTIQREQMGWGLYPDEIEDIRQCPAFDRVEISGGDFRMVLGGALPVRREVTHVSADFFPMLGVKPLLGRTFLPQDEQPGNERVAILSYILWRDSFGSDANIVGRTISVKDEPYAVIGVMPREFELGVDWLGESEDGLWAPRIPFKADRGGRWSVSVLARLKKGATLAGARAQVQTISARFASRFPPGSDHTGLVVSNVQRSTSPDLRSLQTALMILLGAVGFVLLLACVNLGALLTARAWSRQKEIAIRQALGATRLRIVRQLLSESLLLAMAGGALGLLLSVEGIRVLRAIMPPHTPRLDRIVIDARVLWFTTGASFLAAILFGLAPAMQRSARRFGGALAGGLGGSFAGPVTKERHLLRSALVVSEVALAVILVAGGALMLRSFERLVHVDTGVHTDHVLTMWVDLTGSNCQPAQKATTDSLKAGTSHNDAGAPPAPQVCPPSMDELLSRVLSVAGIQNAAIKFGGPIIGGGSTNELIVEGQDGRQISTNISLIGQPVSADYFATMGMRLLKGRDFETNDATSHQNVAIVSESFARQFFSGDALGRRFRTDFNNQQPKSELNEIVGVVNDVRDHGIPGGPFGPPSYYTPYPPGAAIGELLVRTSADPLAVAPVIERIVRSAADRAMITQLETLDQVVADSSSQPRFQAVLLGSFGVLGLLLALIGIYGVLSYSVAQRTSEIGIRMALGASRADTLCMIVGEGMVLTGIGMAIGLAGALALTRVLQDFLFETKPNDPLTFVGVAAALALAALVACYIPALRATRVDPVSAMRCE
jgi:ABC-type lipoprotein release transport system permease subunit